MDTLIIDDILDVYTKEKKINDEEVKKIVKSKLFDDIKKEVKSLEGTNLIRQAEEEKKRILIEAEVEKQRIIEDGKREIEKSKAMYAIEKAKALFKEGVIVAFIVGVLVNQVTDLITPFKELLHNGGKIPVVIITVGIVIVITFLIDRMLKKYYFDKISEWISNKEVKK